MGPITWIQLLVVKINKLINNGFTYARANKLYHQGIQHLNDIWDINNCTLILWNEAQTKLNSIVLDTDDWTLVTTKIMDLWRHRLAYNQFAIHPGQWVLILR